MKALNQKNTSLFQKEFGLPDQSHSNQRKQNLHSTYGSQGKTTNKSQYSKQSTTQAGGGGNLYSKQKSGGVHQMSKLTASKDKANSTLVELSTAKESYYGMFNRNGQIIQGKLQDVFTGYAFDRISNKWSTLERKKAMRQRQNRKIKALKSLRETSNEREKNIRRSMESKENSKASASVSNNRKSGSKKNNPLKKFQGGVLGKYSKQQGANKSVDRSINKTNTGNQSYRFLTKEDSQLSLFTISSAEEKDLNKKAKQKQETRESNQSSSNSQDNGSSDQNKSTERKKGGHIRFQVSDKKHENKLEANAQFIKRMLRQRTTINNDKHKAKEPITRIDTYKSQRKMKQKRETSGGRDKPIRQDSKHHLFAQNMKQNLASIDPSINYAQDESFQFDGVSDRLYIHKKLENIQGNNSMLSNSIQNSKAQYKNNDFRFNVNASPLIEYGVSRNSLGIEKSIEIDLAQFKAGKSIDLYDDSPGQQKKDENNFMKIYMTKPFKVLNYRDTLKMQKIKKKQSQLVNIQNAIASTSQLNQTLNTLNKKDPQNLNQTLSLIKTMLDNNKVIPTADQQEMFNKYMEQQQIFYQKQDATQDSQYSTFLRQDSNRIQNNYTSAVSDDAQELQRNLDQLQKSLIASGLGTQLSNQGDNTWISNPELFLQTLTQHHQQYLNQQQKSLTNQRNSLENLHKIYDGQQNGLAQKLSKYEQKLYKDYDPNKNLFYGSNYNQSSNVNLNASQMHQQNDGLIRETSQDSSHMDGQSPQVYDSAGKTKRVFNSSKQMMQHSTEQKAHKQSNYNGSMQEHYSPPTISSIDNKLNNSGNFQRQGQKQKNIQTKPSQLDPNALKHKKNYYRAATNKSKHTQKKFQLDTLSINSQNNQIQLNQVQNSSKVTNSHYKGLNRNPSQQQNKQNLQHLLNQSNNQTPEIVKPNHNEKHVYKMTTDYKITNINTSVLQQKKLEAMQQERKMLEAQQVKQQQQSLMGQYQSSKYNKTVFPEAKLGVGINSQQYHSRHNTHNQALQGLAGINNLTSQISSKHQKKLLDEQFDQYKNLPQQENSMLINVNKQGGNQLGGHQYNHSMKHSVREHDNLLVNAQANELKLQNQNQLGPQYKPPNHLQERGLDSDETVASYFDNKIKLRKSIENSMQKSGGHTQQHQSQIPSNERKQQQQVQQQQEMNVSKYHHRTTQSQNTQQSQAAQQKQTQINRDLNLPSIGRKASKQKLGGTSNQSNKLDRKYEELNNKIQQALSTYNILDQKQKQAQISNLASNRLNEKGQNGNYMSSKYSTPQKGKVGIDKNFKLPGLTQSMQYQNSSQKPKKSSPNKQGKVGNHNILDSQQSSQNQFQYLNNNVALSQSAHATNLLENTQSVSSEPGYGTVLPSSKKQNKFIKKNQQSHIQQLDHSKQPQQQVSKNHLSIYSHKRGSDAKQQMYNYNKISEIASESSKMVNGGISPSIKQVQDLYNDGTTPYIGKDLQNPNNNANNFQQLHQIQEQKIELIATQYDAHNTPKQQTATKLQQMARKQ